MPLSLIPPTKKLKKKRSNIGSLVLKKAKEPKKLIYASIFIVGVVLILSFYLTIKGHQAFLTRKLSDRKEEVKELEQEKRRLKEGGDVADFQDKLNALNNLVDQHTYWTSLFQFLENATLPKVKFNNFGAELSNRSISLGGETTSFTKLAEQMINFKQHDLVDELKLSSLRMSEEGIAFDFLVQLSPEAWQEVSEKNEP